MLEIDFKYFTSNDLHPQSDFEKKVVDFVEEWKSDEAYVQIQTSGSTGVPKTLEIEKSRMLYSAKMTCDFLHLKEGDSALLCLPIEFISGKMMVVRAIERKLKLYVAEPSLHPMEDFQKLVDFCAMTPQQVEHSLEKLGFIKNVIIGGAQVSANLNRKIHGVLHADKRQVESRVFETFGMSETLSHIALREIYPEDQRYFVTLPGVEISTDDRNCLRIFAPNLHPDILQTNDVVNIVSNNSFEFIGRADFVINSGGAKIFPEELEKFLKPLLDREVLFCGIPDEKWGQKLVLAVEGSENVEIIELIKAAAYPKSYWKPKSIVFMANFPRTQNGKILRREVQAILESTTN